MNLYAEGVKHGGFDRERLRRRFERWCIHNIDVICSVTGHERVTSDAMKDGIYQRPLRCSLLPAPLNFILWQLDDSTQTYVDMQ